MHIDSVVRKTKIILYLTNTTRLNGAFRYIPNSHTWMNSIERTIRKANDVPNFDAVNKEENKILLKITFNISKES